jgi:TetR/AcrR family tetracycline transcriptional repressor
MMAKIRGEEVILAALDMLNDVGLDGLTTRRLAQRLGVESPALYWHFRDKAALLQEMAAHVMLTRRAIAVPTDPRKWAEWFAANASEFRSALLAYRDGARLHAGSKPEARELERVEPKLSYLVNAGIPRHEALMALLAAGRFTLGCVLEEQAPQEYAQLGRGETLRDKLSDENDSLAAIVERGSANHREAFDFGISLLIDGLRERIR